MERLQKVIANSGYCSRRKAEELIKNGKVMVNGKKIEELGFKVDGNDIITVENKILKKENKEYILLYKPRGVVTTTSDEKGRKTVLDLIETNKRLYPVGRLDYDTSGLLLLTNDGELTNILIHPKNEIDKVYIAKINGIMNGFEIKTLEKGVLIDGKKTAPCKVKVRKKEKDSSIIELTIHEGKNHQVKKMFETIGFKVLKLKREKLAFLNLSGLKPGEYRYLSIKEVKMLYSLK
ncbi:MAG: pseudouridine synthase [Candidatus Faecisoma sp.]|jgi:23S rRNA pseudouridine2605 synthase|nr:rRNA pseudouridine synthase [Acholeplasma sp.]MCI5677630.1 rRNA pseudouridine synthase [Acholeplasma sp.]MDY2892944.1 pseudouridine synthase [Candidatus Faecisoma sp.]CCY28887.1 pseudouridine synthase [Acholeplasma sp. CAG:878]